MIDEDFLLVDLFYLLHKKRTDGFSTELKKWLVMLQHKIPYRKVEYGCGMDSSLLQGVGYYTLLALNFTYMIPSH